MKDDAMRVILTAGVLCVALVIAAVTAVDAKPAELRGDAIVTPTTLVGE